MSEQVILVVASFFKGTTINKNKRLDHESLSHPETDILKYHEYRQANKLKKMILTRIISKGQ